MWPFFLTHTHIATRKLSASPATLLSLLHGDPERLFGLSPLVVSVTKDPDSLSYTVVEEIPVLGRVKTKTTFTVTVKLLEDGVENYVVAGLGTRSTNSFHVRKCSEDDMCELVHHTTTRGSFLFMWYIVRTQMNGHELFRDEIQRLLEGGRTVGDNNRRLAQAPSTTESRDPYSLYHLTLNKRPGDQSNVPSTEWLNSGYWKDTDVFPDACRALALKLNQAANRRDGDSVLDVGHGTGESLIFMLTDPAVPRPSRIVGITSLPIHHQRTKERVARLQDSKTQVDLYLGDAVYRPSSIGHPLAPQSDMLFDCVLALDCAYHFNTRQDFLSQSLVKLVAGGKIALVDMCFEPRYRWLVWLTTKLRIAPKENIVTVDEYALALKRAGFIDIEIEDLTSAILPKFLLFLKGVGPQWWLFSMLYGWYLYGMGVKIVLASGSRPRT